MTPDISRVTFDPSKRYSRVIMQQGRVQLDSDWNEQADIMLATARKTLVDLVGSSAAPPDPAGSSGSPGSAPANFKIAISPPTTPPSATEPIDDLLIARGRYYVDGILCDNADDTGSSSPISFLDQPYVLASSFFDKPQFPFLVYLDVWEEIVTTIDAPELLEPALNGLDTTARARVQWAVRAEPFDGAAPRGGSPPGTFPTAPIASDSVFDKIDNSSPAYLDPKIKRRGLMRADTSVPDADQDSVCAIAPDSQYRGTENQLYRVEIHSGGKLVHPLNTAEPHVNPTFKWSRDNGSVAFVITAVTGSDGPWTVTLEDLGKDDRHTLDIGDWVEIFEAGALRRNDQAPDLLKVTAIDPIAQTVDLNRPLSSSAAGVPPVIAYTADAISKSRPMLRRWDQTRDVTDPKTDGGPALGTIEINQQRPVLSDNTNKATGWNSQDDETWFDLEDGLRVQFQRPDFANDSVGVFFAGDYWLIPARTASNGTILWATNSDGSRKSLPPARAEASLRGTGNRERPGKFRDYWSSELRLRSPSDHQPCPDRHASRIVQKPRRRFPVSQTGLHSRARVMPGSGIVDLAIGMFFIYFLLSVLCSGANEWLAAITASRSRSLEIGIRSLLSDPAGRGLAAQVLDHPLIKTLKSPGKISLPGILSTWFSGFGQPAYISANLFVTALFDRLAPAVRDAPPQGFDDIWNALQAKLKEQADLKDSNEKKFATLMSEATQLATAAKVNRDSAKAKEAKAKEGEATQAKADVSQAEQAAQIFAALLAIAGRSPNDLAAFRKNMETWYDEGMERISGWYKRKCQLIMTLISAVVCLAINADGVNFLQYLNQNSAARTMLAASAASLVEQERIAPLLTSGLESPGPNSTDEPKRATPDAPQTQPANKPADNKPAESKAGDSRPADKNAGENKPAETKASEAKTGENKAALTKSAKSQPLKSNAEKQNAGDINAAETSDSNSIAANAGRIEMINQKLASLSLPIGWDLTNFSWPRLFESLSPEGVKLSDAELKERQQLVKLTDSEYVARLRQLPLNSYEWLIKAIGLLFSTFAMSMGANFYFQLLSQFVNLRHTGEPPDAKKPK